MRSLLLSILVTCFYASSACAWHEAGHRTTAEIAFDLLSESDQQHVTAILRAHPRFREDFIGEMPKAIANGTEHEKSRWLFAQASIWPDLIQTLGQDIRRQYHHSTWHYINLPVYLTEEDEEELASRLDHNMSMEFTPPMQHRMNLIQALKGNLHVWRDESATDSEKAMALSWILHLAGDLHEPLHNVALFSSALFPEGDRGGNMIAVSHNDEVTNLHAVWDGMSNRIDDLSLDADTQKMLTGEVADLHSIDVWTNDQLALANEFVYTAEVKRQLLDQEPGEQNAQITLSTEYFDTAEKIARTRIIIAGHRIAALISN